MMAAPTSAVKPPRHSSFISIPAQATTKIAGAHGYPHALNGRAS
jgi:hypothetical protein